MCLASSHSNHEMEFASTRDAAGRVVHRDAHEGIDLIDDHLIQALGMGECDAVDRCDREHSAVSDERTQRHPFAHRDHQHGRCVGACRDEFSHHAVTFISAFGCQKERIAVQVSHRLWNIHCLVFLLEKKGLFFKCF